MGNCCEAFCSEYQDTSTNRIRSTISSDSIYSKSLHRSKINYKNYEIVKLKKFKLHKINQEYPQERCMRIERDIRKRMKAYIKNKYDKRYQNRRYRMLKYDLFTKPFISKSPNNSLSSSSSLSSPSSLSSSSSLSSTPNSSSSLIQLIPLRPLRHSNHIIPFNLSSQIKNENKSAKNENISSVVCPNSSYQSIIPVTGIINIDKPQAIIRTSAQSRKPSSLMESFVEMKRKDEKSKRKSRKTKKKKKRKSRLRSEQKAESGVSTVSDDAQNTGNTENIEKSTNFNDLTTKIDSTSFILHNDHDKKLTTANLSTTNIQTTKANSNKMDDLKNKNESTYGFESTDKIIQANLNNSKNKIISNEDFSLTTSQFNQNKFDYAKNKQDFDVSTDEKVHETKDNEKIEKIDNKSQIKSQQILSNDFYEVISKIDSSEDKQES